MIDSLPHSESISDQSSFGHDLRDCATALSCEVKTLELHCLEVRNLVHLACAQLDSIMNDLLKVGEPLTGSLPAIQNSVSMAKPEDTSDSVDAGYNIWRASTAQ